MGYLILSWIGNVGEIDPRLSVERIGVYYSRHGLLKVWPVARFVSNHATRQGIADEFERILSDDDDDDDDYDSDGDDDDGE